MKTIRILAVCVSLAVVAAVQGTTQEPGPAEVQESSAMAVFAKLVGGTWVRESTRESGEEVRAEIRYTEGTSPLSVFLDVRIWVEGVVWEDLHGTIALHPHTGKVVVQTVNSLNSYQEGEEIESSDSHVVMKGVAYHLDGSADQWTWTVRHNSRDEYIDQVMVFGDGAWQQRPASVFRRVR